MKEYQRPDNDVINLSSSAAAVVVPRAMIPVSSAPRRRIIGGRDSDTHKIVTAADAHMHKVIARSEKLATTKIAQPYAGKIVTDPDAWDAFVIEQAGTSILQAYEWGELKREFGWNPLRLMIEEHGTPVAGAQILLKNSPIGPMAYIPHGPLVDWNRRELVHFTMQQIHKQLRRRMAVFVKVEPALKNEASIASTLTNEGFRQGDTIQPRSTIIVDLKPSFEQLSAKLNIKMRYNMRLAERRGVTCMEGTAADIPLFYRLMQATSQRAGFSIHSLDYYRRIWEKLEQRGMAQLLFATYGEHVLATTMLFVLGNRAYSMYSGSSELHRNLKPNDFLQWESIKWAKNMGCTSYDLWGIPDEVGERHESGLSVEMEDMPGERSGELWGVYQFKRGLGGEIVRFCGPYDYVYSPAGYWLMKRAIPYLKEFRNSVRERRQQAMKTQDSKAAAPQTESGENPTAG